MAKGVLRNESGSSWRSACIASVALTVLFMLPFIFFVAAGNYHVETREAAATGNKRLLLINTTAASSGRPAPGGPGRKLLQSIDGGDGDGDGDGGDMNRIGAACSKDDITIFQGETAPLPSGIPAYTVQILNMCVSGCSISDIHISCGWFSSARLVNPRVFRRMDYDDCLVNDGQPLGPGQTLSFQYANTFRYPLSVSSVTC